MIIQKRILRATDQETARVVTIHSNENINNIVGAGCLVDSKYILTCDHVVRAAINDQVAYLYVGLPGVTGQPIVKAKISKSVQCVKEPQNDLALLEIMNDNGLEGIQPIEFASPLRHSGKSYSVLGFPGGDVQGHNACGRLFSANAKGLIQMDQGGMLSVLGGFSGAPVWSPDLNAFVGLVVTELSKYRVSWCIPSRRLCQFYPELRVRFRIPVSDRPIINDYHNDDPNKYLFGDASESNNRKLSATVKKHKNYYKVNVFYQCTSNPLPTGHFVSFITYPDFKTEKEDAYELFAELEKKGSIWQAEQEFYPTELFTIAAIGDGGDSVLTLDLTKIKN